MVRKITYFFIIMILSIFVFFIFLQENKKDNGDLNLEIPPYPEKLVELVTLYFADHQRDYLVRENRIIERTTESKEKMIVEELIKGPVEENLKPVFPPNVQIYSVTTNDDTVYVNLSREVITDHSNLKNVEALTIYSIVNSLTELGGIEKVQILIEGEKRDRLQKYIGLQQPYKRNLNIVGAPFPNPLEVIKEYFALLEAGDYRAAYDLLYRPMEKNIDYAMYYHHMKKLDIRKFNIYSYRMTNQTEEFFVVLDYEEISSTGKTKRHRGKKFKFRNDFGEWKLELLGL